MKTSSKEEREAALKCVSDLLRLESRNGPSEAEELARLSLAISKHGDTHHPMAPLVCGRCYEEVDELFDSGCNENPEDLKGQPIGQYHCPDCGAMVLAGAPHPQVCERCRDRKHPGFDER